MASKSIHIISSYTVSKLRRFFWDTVYLTTVHCIRINTNNIIRQWTTMIILRWITPLPKNFCFTGLVHNFPFTALNGVKHRSSLKFLIPRSWQHVSNMTGRVLDNSSDLFQHSNSDSLWHCTTVTFQNCHYCTHRISQLQQKSTCTPVGRQVQYMCNLRH